MSEQFGAAIAVEPATEESAQELRNTITQEFCEEIVQFLERNYSQRLKMIPEKIRQQMINDIIASPANYNQPAQLVTALISLVERMEKATMSRHLASIATNNSSLRSFCPRCGRHYRYHNRHTGECPRNPLGPEEPTRSPF